MSRNCLINYKKQVNKHINKKKIVKHIIAVLIRTGGIGATELSGSLNGTTFSNNKGGAYARTRVHGTNPRTTAQTAVRNEFAYLSQHWRTLTEANRLSWKNAAAATPRINRLGISRHISGFNYYKSFNQNLFDAGQSLLANATAPVGTTNVSSLSFVANHTGPTMVTTFASTPTAANMTILVFATAQYGAGITATKGKFRIISTLPAATATGADVQAAYIARFGALVVGMKVSIAFVAVNNLTGEKSPSIIATTTVI